MVLWNSCGDARKQSEVTWHAYVFGPSDQSPVAWALCIDGLLAMRLLRQCAARIARRRVAHEFIQAAIKMRDHFIPCGAQPAKVFGRYVTFREKNFLRN